MAVFDPKQVSVLILDYRIQDWHEGGDVIHANFRVDHGELSIGAGGTGVFVQHPDESGELVLQLKQHSRDNNYLDSLRRSQRQSIRSFVPLTLSIRDMLNEDVVTAEQGYFTVAPPYIRGNAANPVTWTMVFERMAMRLEVGLFN
ncbi:phage protein [Paraburkholderia sp. BR10923]|uniref:phage protein n=1 Tax=Paraburkholderia sp. BR10923 TaxID=3236992 RepID=UPI0034CECABB